MLLENNMNNKMKENKDEVFFWKKSTSAASVNASLNVAASQTHIDKFHASQGHGFAAERYNNLYDILSGKDSVIIGGNNQKNGADRLVDGQTIQTKYCKSPSASVAAAFDHGQYRYINKDGSLMQLEVPYEQYPEAVRLFAEQIKMGHVQGVTDPNDAKDIVRQGQCTYNQAKNVAKFGKIDSLRYDMMEGAVISANAFGITAVLTFAQSLWNGDTFDIAVEKAAYAGIQIGGASFVTSVIVSQLMRTGINRVLTSQANSVTKVLGRKISEPIADSLRSSANVYGSSSMRNLDKLLRGNVISTVVMTLVLSARDISNAFQGRISGQQLFKNIVVKAGGMLCGNAGALLGNYLLDLVVPGAGKAAHLIVSLVGAAAIGTMGGDAVNTVVGKFIEDDAVALVKIVEDTLIQLAQDYMLTHEELEIILEEICIQLNEEKLLDMYASQDQMAFADRLVRDRSNVW